MKNHSGTAKMNAMKTMQKRPTDLFPTSFRQFL